MRALWTLAFVTLLAGVATAAHADDWTAVRLRGTVVQFVDGAWKPVHRNDVVPDETVVRTLGNGYADFARGTETVSVSPNTQIEIFDKGTGKPFTTVQQSFGTVAIEAEVENVQHFAVETPYLAAVVKGTHFTVTSGKTGSSVSVQRGHVEVDNKHNHSRVMITVGQTASVGNGTDTSSSTTVSGSHDTSQGTSGTTGVVGGVVNGATGAVGGVVDGATGAVGGIVDGIGDGLKQVFGNNGNGNDNGKGTGNGKGNSSDGNSSEGNSSDGNSSEGNNSGPNLNLHLRLGYDVPPPDPIAPVPLLWV